MEVLARPRVIPFPPVGPRVGAPGEEVVPRLPARGPAEATAREARDDEGPQDLAAKAVRTTLRARPARPSQAIRRLARVPPYEGNAPEAALVEVAPPGLPAMGPPRPTRPPILTQAATRATALAPRVPLAPYQVARAQVMPRRRRGVTSPFLAAAPRQVAAAPGTVVSGDLKPRTHPLVQEGEVFEECKRRERERIPRKPAQIRDGQDGAVH